MSVEVEQQNVGYKEDDTFTCERCSHFSVCMVRKNISDFMEQHFPSDKPFEESELAKICSEYEPVLNVVFEK